MLRIQALLLPLLLLLLAGGEVVADRPGDQSICDHYAAKNFKENNSTTQLRLMQGIVAYAYAGGNTLAGSEDNSTGIFNRGRFGEQDVFLRPWFDGSSMAASAPCCSRPWPADDETRENHKPQ